ncbi:MAG: hypothetical protein P4N59_08600 [Negativicutes bacterium]|nr:hypothetical protein [Negativicutes bacterium]
MFQPVIPVLQWSALLRVLVPALWFVPADHLLTSIFDDSLRQGYGRRINGYA